MAHAQIDIGFRILEYLEPDNIYKPEKIKQSIMDKFLRRDVLGAVRDILNELGIDDDYGLERAAVDFAHEVLNDFLNKKKQENLSERERLLIRLGELDKELG